ncbi:HAD-superfamily hydrolase subfamily IG 5'-nucleotidase [Citrus sinensis]|nr:HAD-superfamily hydrolase subfamily IG 5'-nucleotidase [Citrus sinensis]
MDLNDNYRARFTKLLGILGRRSFSPGAREGFNGSLRSYNATLTPEQTLLQIVKEVKQDGADNSVMDDEIAKIRQEFNAAKQSFLKIPEALKEMPKMNPEGIYVNKNLRLDNIQVYGFDYDYTLAHYSSNLQSLIYDLAKEHMVNEFRYPEVCISFKYDPNFPIRGLYYDKQKGCLLKLDFFGSIEPDGCYFGRRKLSRKEIAEIYGTRHIGRDQARGLVGLMDFFCFSEACLIADIVQYFVDAKLEFDASYIYEDVNRAIQHVHRRGLVHRGILSDPNRYLVKNGQVLQLVKMLREKGKKLFLLTNSPYYFVDGGMRFMLEVIYFGDHLFSDLRGPSKAGWRTAAIIHELEAKFHIIQELLGKLHATVANSQRTEACQLLLAELNEERQKARRMMKKMFNKSFGATFLTDTGQESAFAYHIHRYADVYTSKAENFLLYPPEAWLHVPFDIKIMPHHVKVSRCLNLSTGPLKLVQKSIVGSSPAILD